MSSVLKYTLNLAGQPASSYAGYLEADGPVGASGPSGTGTATGLPPIKFDSSGHLKAADGASDYLIAAAVGGSPGHVVPLSLTIMLNGVPVGLVRFDAIETSAGIVDIDVLYLQGKTQPATPEQLASLNSMLGQGTTLLPQMTQQLADNAQSASAALSAATEALATVDVNPAYISYTTANPPSATVTGTGGAKLDSDGAVQKLVWSGAAWVARGSPITSKDTIRSMANTLSTLHGMTTEEFLDRGLQPRYSGTNIDFGLKADGSDNSVAFGVLSAVTQERGGMYAQLDSGLYVAGDAALTSSLYLQARGKAAIIKQKAGSQFVMGYGRDSVADPSGANNLKYIGLSGLTLQGTVDVDAFSEQIHLLNLNGVEDFILDRLSFIGWRGDAVYIGSGLGVEKHNKRVKMLYPYFDGVNNDQRNAVSIIDIDGFLMVEPTAKNCTRPNMPGFFDAEPNANSYHVIDNIEIQGGDYDNVGGNAGVVGLFVPAAAAAVGVIPQNFTISGKPKYRNITNTAGVYQFIVQRAPDITVTTTASASSGAVSLTVSALTAPLGIGAQLVFGAVTATLTAAAAYGATSLTVSALSGAVASGAVATRTTPDMHIRVGEHDVQTANRLYTIDGVTDLQIAAGTYADVANAAQIGFFGGYGVRDFKIATRLTRVGTSDGSVLNFYGQINGLDLRETLFNDCGSSSITSFGVYFRAGAVVKRLKWRRLELRNPNAKDMRASQLEASRVYNGVTYPAPVIDVASSEYGDNVFPVGTLDPIGLLLKAGAPSVIPRSSHGTAPDLAGSAFYPNTFPAGMSYTPVNGATNGPASVGDMITFIDPTFGADGLGFAWQEFHARGPGNVTWIRYPAGITAGGGWGTFSRIITEAELATEASGGGAAAQGYLAWSVDAKDATTSYAPASGNLMLGYGRASRSVAVGSTLTAKLYMVSAGSGLTEGRVGVYRASDGALVASSANLASTLFAGSTGALSVPLSASVAINALDYLYSGTLAVGTTTPSFTAPPAASAVFNLLGLNRRALKSGQTSLPATLGSLSNANQVAWVGLY